MELLDLRVLAFRVRDIRRHRAKVSVQDSPVQLESASGIQILSPAPRLAI